MSRNPHKTRCQVPGSRNWAMRGHTHCRPRRDPELRPRGAGATPGNLNAHPTGQCLSPDGLDHLAHAILTTLDQLPGHLYRTIHTIHRRCRDPVETLLALLSRVAGDLFTTDLHVLLDQLPPARQSHFELSLWRQALQFGPVDKLELLRRLQRTTSAQSPGAARAPSPGPPPSAPDAPDPDIEPPEKNPMERQLPGIPLGDPPGLPPADPAGFAQGVLHALFALLSLAPAQNSDIMGPSCPKVELD